MNVLHEVEPAGIWASLYIRLASCWDEPSFKRKLFGAVRVWRDLLEALSDPTWHEGKSGLARGLIPAAGPTSRPAFLVS